MKTFKKADILIPNKDIDMTKWSVVACDQYTSEPAYWDKVKSIVGSNKSTLNIILPEIYLESDNVSERIKNINSNMDNLLSSNSFVTLKDSIIYLERTDNTGKIRKGIIGMVDLEDYSYEKGSQTLIRATEKTVIERIPPRMKVRENASIESPHIMLLIDDEAKNIIDNLNNKVSENEIIYDFDLMQNGGHVRGYKLNNKVIDDIMVKLDLLTDKNYFEKKYNVKDKGVLLFSVGDGNHSLATAKACYEKIKGTMTKEEYENHPSRYALVEIVNVHSDALEFEPIHRVMFDIDTKDVLDKLYDYYNINESDNGQKVEICCENIEKTIYISNPKSNLAVGSVQAFIDDYIKKSGGKVDYIHGDDVAKTLGKKKGNISFLLPPMKKNDLFKTVILDGALPRKTFSMGHSYDKRYYLECRKIK